jgi:hypothetical protein
MRELSTVEEYLFIGLDSNKLDIGVDNVYVGQAPEASTKPFILIQFVSSEDMRCGFSNITGTMFKYLIEVFVEGESFPYTESEEMDLLLNGAVSTLNDIKINIARINPTSTVDHYEGHEIRRSGGMYQIIARRLA